MLDKSFFDFQLVEVFGQFELEELEFRFIEKLLKDGRAQVPRGRYPGLLVKSSLVALSFPGLNVVFYSQPDAIQKLTSRLGEIGVGRVGLLGEMVTDSDIERLFQRVRLGQISLLAVHRSQIANPVVAQGFQSVSAKPGVGFCILDPELFNAAETMDWHGLTPQLTTLLEVCPSARILDMGTTEDQAAAGSGFELSDAEKAAIFGPMDGGGDDDDEEFMRTVIRTSPFKDGPSGPPIPLEAPIKMPSRDEDDPPPPLPEPVATEPESGVITRIERATGLPIPREESSPGGPPSLIDALNADAAGGDEGGFQTISRILGRAGDIPDSERESFLESRSKIAVSRPPKASFEDDGITWPGLEDETGGAAATDERDGLSLDEFVSSPGQGLSHSAEMIPLDDLMAPSSPGTGMSSSAEVAALDDLMAPSSPGSGLSASSDALPLDELIGGDNDSVVDLGPVDDEVEVLLDDDEDELLVLVDDDDDDVEFGGPNLENLLDGLDAADESTGDASAGASPDDLAKALSSTFPTRGPAETEEVEERDESLGAVSRIVLPDELPSEDLASRTGAVTSIILPSDVPTDDLDEVLDDDLDDLLGPDLDGDEEPPDTDMLLADLTPLDDEEELVVAEYEAEVEPLDEPAGEEEYLVGLLDSIVSETKREPEGQSPSSAIILPDEVPTVPPQAEASPLDGLDLDALVQPIEEGPHPGTVSGILLPDEDDTSVSDLEDVVDESSDVPDELSDEDIEFALQSLADEQLSEEGQMDLNAVVAASEEEAGDEADFDDYESPEAIEFALRALAEEELADGEPQPMLQPVAEEPQFDAIEESLNSAVRLPQIDDEPEVAVAEGTEDFSDFDSPDAVAAALASLEEEEQPAEEVFVPDEVDELVVEPVAQEEITGNQNLPDVHLELDPMADLDDDDSPEAIEAALKALAEEELAEQGLPPSTPPVAEAVPVAEPVAAAEELIGFETLDSIMPSNEAVIGNESLPDTHLETEDAALDDLDSPEAIEAALRRLAEEELAEEGSTEAVVVEEADYTADEAVAEPVAEPVAEVELDPLDQMLAAADASEEEVFGEEVLPDTHLEGDDVALDDLDSPEAIEAALRRLAEEELREEGGTPELEPLPEPAVEEADGVSTDSILLDEVMEQPVEEPVTEVDAEPSPLDAFADFEGLDGLADALAVLPDDDGNVDLPEPEVAPAAEAVDEEAPPELSDFFGDNLAPDEAWVQEAIGSGSTEPVMDAFEQEPEVQENSGNLPGLHLELDDDALDDLDSPEAIEEALRRLAEEELQEEGGQPEPEPIIPETPAQEEASSSEEMLLDQGIDEEPAEEQLDPLDQMLASQAAEEEIIGDGNMLDTHLEMDDDVLDDMDSPEAIEAALRRLAQEELQEEGGAPAAAAPAEAAPAAEMISEPVAEPVVEEAFDVPDEAWVQEALGGAPEEEDIQPAEEQVFGEEILPDTHLEMEEDALDDMDSPEAIEAALRRLAEEELREEGPPAGAEELPVVEAVAEAEGAALEDELLAAVEEESASDSASSEPMTDVGAFLADLQLDDEQPSGEDSLVQGLSDELLAPLDEEEEPLSLSDIIGEDEEPSLDDVIAEPNPQSGEGLSTDSFLLDDVITDVQPEAEPALSTDSLLLDALISEGAEEPGAADSFAELDALAELDAMASEEPEVAVEPVVESFDEPALGDLVSGPSDLEAMSREEEQGAVSRVILPGEEDEAMAELDALAALDAMVDEETPQEDPLAELDAMAELDELSAPQPEAEDPTAQAVEDAIAALGQPETAPEPVPFDEPALGDLVSGPSDETAQAREEEMGAVSRVILPGEEGSGLADLDALIDTLETGGEEPEEGPTDTAAAISALAELDNLVAEDDAAPAPEPVPFDEPALGDLVSGPSDLEAMSREEEQGAISRVVLPGEEPAGLDFLDEMLGDVEPTAEPMATSMDVGPGEGLETSPGEAIVPKAPVDTEMQAAFDATLDETLNALATRDESPSDTLVESPLEEALGGIDDEMPLPVASTDTLVEGSMPPLPDPIESPDAHEIPRDALDDLESSLGSDLEPIEEPPLEESVGLLDLQSIEEGGSDEDAFEAALAEAEAVLEGEDLQDLSDGLVVRDELGQERALTDVEGSFVAAEDALSGLEPLATAPASVPQPLEVVAGAAEASAAPAFVPPPSPVVMPADYDLSPGLHRILRQTEGDFSKMYQAVELTVSDPEENASRIEEELLSLQKSFTADRHIVFALGTIEMLRRRTAGGVAHYLHATELCRRENDLENEAYVYGRLHENNPEDVGVAERYADSLLALDQQLQATFILTNSADRLVETGNVQDAIALFEKVADLEPDDDGALRKLLSAYRSSGRESQALEFVNARLAAEPKRLELQLQKGISLIRLGRVERSEEAFKNVLDLVWDDPFKLIEMEERFDEYSVVVYRERCRSRILELDPTNAKIRGKIEREERLKALEADAPVIEDLLPFDEPDDLSEADSFDDDLDDLEALGAEEEDEDDVFSRTISVSPKFTRLVESLRGLEEELQVAEAGDRVADRFLAELVRKFLEVGERVGVEHPTEALELYERSRSYLPYFKDPMALFLWTEQLDRRIDNTRCRIN